MEYRVERLMKRVAALEVRDTKLMTSRLDDFQKKLNHLYVQVCKKVGVIDMSTVATEERTKEADPRAGVQAIAQEMQRESARKDGGRKEGRITNG